MKPKNGVQKVPVVEQQKPMESDPMARKRKKELRSILNLTGILAVVLVAFYFVSTNPSSLEDEWLRGLGIGLAISAAIVGFSLGIVLLIAIGHRRWLAVPFIGLLTLSFLSYLYQSRREAEVTMIREVLPVMHEAMSELIITRREARLLAGTGKVTAKEGAWIQEHAETATMTLLQAEPKVNYRLEPYLQAGIDYAAVMHQAVEKGTVWKDVPELPVMAVTKFPDYLAEEAYGYIMVRLAEMKEFGDNAIKRKDTLALVRIASRMTAFHIFINHYEVASRADSFHVAALFPTAEAAKVVRYSAICPRGGCRQDLRMHLKGTFNATNAYLAGTPDAPEQWQNAWKEAAPLLNAVRAGGGLTAGEPDPKAKYSPTVQAFMDECGGKGGIVGGTGGIKARLPTTESGYTCWYPKGGKCWDFLTYTGGRYLGGNATDCEEHGLVPPQPLPEAPPAPPQKPTTPGTSPGTAPGGTSPPVQPVKPTSWDGTYRMTMSGGCSGLPSEFANMVPAGSQFTVRGNRIYGTGTSMAIDANGNARFSEAGSASGLSYRVSQTLKFTPTSGGGVRVTGNASVRMSGDLPMSCDFGFSGSRL